MISWERHLLVTTLSVCVGGRWCVGALPMAAALLTDPDDSDVALLELANPGNRPYMVERLPVCDRAEPAGHSGK